MMYLLDLGYREIRKYDGIFKHLSDNSNCYFEHMHYIITQRHKALRWNFTASWYRNASDLSNPLV